MVASKIVRLEVGMTAEEQKLFEDMSQFIEDIPDDEWDHLPSEIQTILERIRDDCSELLELIPYED